MEPNGTREAKLVQYLSEAYGNEKRLETALEAHIGMATRKTYKQRLRQHLTETKGHARQVERRIKKLGGQADTTPGAPSALTDFAGAVLSTAQKATALAQGPLHTLRGTGEEEKQLKNAKTEYAEEAQEIATYAAIETLATAVGDKETAQLARIILRDEKRMFGFLEKEIVRMTNAVVRAEIPAAERNGSGRTSTRSRATSRTRPATAAAPRRSKAKTTGAATNSKSPARKRSRTAR